jgi:hypothetical protein
MKHPLLSAGMRDAACVGATRLLFGFSLPIGAVAPAQTAAESFDLREVRLMGGPFKQAMDLNSQFHLTLELDRFLCYFRTNAELGAKAKAYGG